MKAETAEYLLNLEKKLESENNRRVFYAVFFVSLFSFVYDEYYLGKDFSDWSPISKIFIVYSIFHIYFLIFIWNMFIKPSAENALMLKRAKEEEKIAAERREEESKKKNKKKTNEEYLFKS